MRKTLPLRWRLLLLLALLGLLLPSRPASAQPPSMPLAAPAPLSYFALSASLQAPLRLGAGLDPAQFARVRRIAEREQAQLRRLLQESQPIVSDPALSLAQKRLRIQRLGYNRRVEAILYASDRSLRTALDPAAYSRLVAWMAARWPIERRLHGAPHGAGLPGWDLASLLSRLFPVPAPPAALLQAPLQAPRTYEIFATRYDAKGRYTAALPDQCLKLTNGGLRTCVDKGYVVGQRYEIFMSYKGGKKGVGVLVAEAGPWNIDDNFWATLADPTPRRLFADLALGMPEAQAAFYNGYNGGLDQYGRKVTAPFAIDLAFEVADDLGLPARANDWINVSFMWTDGWGSSAGQPGAAPAAQIAPLETAAYRPDGSQVHTVQSGQTLWAIAVAYGVTIQRLRELNGLPAPAAEGQGDVILPGQELLVRPAGSAPTPQAGSNLETGTPAVTDNPAAADKPAANSPAERPSLTPRRPSGAATASLAPAAGQATALAQALDPGAPASAPAKILGQRSTGLLPYLIGGLLLVGLALYLLGKLISRA